MVLICSDISDDHCSDLSRVRSFLNFLFKWLATMSHGLMARYENQANQEQRKFSGYLFYSHLRLQPLTLYQVKQSVPLQPALTLCTLVLDTPTLVPGYNNRVLRYEFFQFIFLAVLRAKCLRYLSVTVGRFVRR